MISTVSLGAEGQKSDVSFAFFAFDNYMNVDGYIAPQVRANTLKELGYDGMGTTGANLAEQKKVFEKAGVKLFSTYLHLDLDAKQKYDPNLRNTIKQLKGTGTILWFFVTSKKYKPGSPEGDSVAVKAIRDLTDEARDSGLKIALYPIIH